MSGRCALNGRCALALVASVVTVILVFPGNAHAADPATEAARKHFQAGQDLYDVGRWDEAAAEFEQAYSLRKDPSFLYNMAQAFRRKGDAKRALDLYKNFLIKTPDSPQRPEVEERIKTLQHQLDVEADRMNKPVVLPAVPQQPATPAAPPMAPQPQPVAQQPPPASLASPENTVQIPVSSPAPPEQPGRGLRIAGVTLGVVALASAGTGAFWGWRAKSLSDKVSGASTFKPADEDAAKQAETLQWVFYGVGAGAAIAGGVLYWLGWSSAKHDPAPVVLAPTLVPHGAGLTAQGGF